MEKKRISILHYLSLQVALRKKIYQNVAPQYLWDFSAFIIFFVHRKTKINKRTLEISIFSFLINFVSQNHIREQAILVLQIYTPALKVKLL
jgi:hypothetical protein